MGEVENWWINCTCKGQAARKRTNAEGLYCTRTTSTLCYIMFNVPGMYRGREGERSEKPIHLLKWRRTSFSFNSRTAVASAVANLTFCTTVSEKLTYSSPMGGRGGTNKWKAATAVALRVSRRDRAIYHPAKACKDRSHFLWSRFILALLSPRARFQVSLIDYFRCIFEMMIRFFLFNQACARCFRFSQWKFRGP